MYDWEVGPLALASLGLLKPLIRSADPCLSPLLFLMPFVLFG